MRVYMICTRRDGDRWHLDGIVTSQGAAERQYRESAKLWPAALSEVDLDGEPSDGYFMAAYHGAGFDRVGTVAKPPGRVLMQRET